MKKSDTFVDDHYYKKFHEKPMTVSSRSRCKIAMRAYLRFYKEEKGLQLMPEELLERIDEDRKKEIRDRGQIEREWLEFTEWLRRKFRKQNKDGSVSDKPLGATSIKSYTGIIKTFYAYFGFPLGKQAQLPRQISSIKRKPENTGIEYRPLEVRKLLSVMRSNRDKAITLVMFQSGMDISTALSLTYGHIKRELETWTPEAHRPILIDVLRAKAGVNYRTFLGKDAIMAIKIWLAEKTSPRYWCKACGVSWRDRRNTCSKCGRNMPQEPEKTVLRNDTLLFTSNSNGKGMTASNYQKTLRHCAKLAGLVTEDDLERADLNPARPHALRAGFSSILRLKGVNRDIVEHFIGHKDEYGGAYVQHSNEELREIYAQYEEFLSVSDVRDIADVEKKLEKQIGSLGNELSSKLVEIETLEMKNENMGARLEKLENRLGEVEDREKQRATAIAGDMSERDFNVVRKLLEIVESRPYLLKELENNLRDSSLK